jgi:hypothetical protein
MSAGNLNGSGHSAQVRMELHVNGHVLPIAQLGPDFLVLTNPIDHPPGDAEIAMSIDGHESRWPVRLLDGLSSQQRRAPIARCQAANGSTVG